MESESIPSRGGRPIAVIEPRPEGACFIGVDVGGRGVAAELFDFAMNRLDVESREGHADESPAGIAHNLGLALAALELRNPESWSRLTGIGLGLPGIVESGPDGTQMLYAQSLGWEPVPVADLVTATVPVFAENGANAAAKAEQWFGSVRGVDHAAVVLLGRGVGLGLISGGLLQHGARGSASEWGHVKIERDGRLCRCGGRGCLEAYLGADAILAAHSAVGEPHRATGWEALNALLDADGEDARVAGDIVATLGRAIGSLVNLTNPQRVVVGGWVGMILMERFGPQIETSIRDNALDRPGRQFELLPSTFKGDATALGAASLPMEDLIRGH